MKAALMQGISLLKGVQDGARSCQYDSNLLSCTSAREVKHKYAQLVTTLVD